MDEWIDEYMSRIQEEMLVEEYLKFLENTRPEALDEWIEL